MTKQPDLTTRGTPRKRPTRRDYTDQEIDAGLTAYALCSGHRERAADLTKQTLGFRIPGQTLYDWATRKRTDQYLQIQAEVMPKIQAQKADRHSQLADEAMDLEAAAIERLKANVNSLDLKDLSNVVQRAGVVSGIHTDKTLALTGQPTQIVRHEVTEVMRSLKSKGMDADIEAEVVSEELVPA